jgi:hypothetical protein
VFARDIGGYYQAWKQYEAVGGEPKCLLQAYPWKYTTQANKGKMHLYIILFIFCDVLYLQLSFIFKEK